MSNGSGAGGSSSSMMMMMMMMMMGCCVVCSGSSCMVYTQKDALCENNPSLRDILCPDSGTPTPQPSTSTPSPSGTPTPKKKTTTVKTTVSAYKRYPKSASSTQTALTSVATMVSSSKSCENQCKSNTSCGGFALSRAKDASSKKYQCWIKGTDAITKPTGQTTFAKTSDWDLYVRPSSSG